MKKLITTFLLLFISSFLFSQNLLVQNIQAKYTRGTKIHIYWDNPKIADNTITKYFLYRNIKPILSYADIEKCTFIKELSPTSTEYTDSVNDYNNYYYAIITFTTKPYDIVLVSANSTAIGVSLIPNEKKEIAKKQPNKEKLYSNGTKRETPLPYLNMIEGLDKSEEVISKEVTNATSQFYSITKVNSQKQLLPYYFEEDLISPDSGDEYLLFEILRDYFVQERYEESVQKLEILVKRNINQNVINRAYFYIGQSEYFLADYENALKCFIKIKSAYPNQTRPWINASLNNLEIN